MAWWTAALVLLIAALGAGLTGTIFSVVDAANGGDNNDGTFTLNLAETRWQRMRAGLFLGAGLVLGTAAGICALMAAPPA